MKHKNSFRRNVWKYLWQNISVIIILLSVIGIGTGVWGFLQKPTEKPIQQEISVTKQVTPNEEQEKTIGDAFYNTFQLFLMHHSFEKEKMNCYIEMSRWIIFLVILLLSRELFLLLFSEQLKRLKIRYFYSNHIVICGNTEIGIGLLKKYSDEKQKVIFIVDENIQNLKNIAGNKVVIIEGNATRQHILKRSKIEVAAKFFAVTNNDSKNIEIAQSVWFYLTQKKNPDPKINNFSPQKIATLKKEPPLKCYTLVQDNDLKNDVEDTPLFKYKPKENEVYYFDGAIFNFNETGIRYGICLEIEKIIPKPCNVPPKILLLELTVNTEFVLLSLAHSLTTAGKPFEFVIEEENEKNIIDIKRRFKYIFDFAKIEFVEKLEQQELKTKNFDSIFVCSTDRETAIKTAINIRYKLQNTSPNIFLFSNDSKTVNRIFNPETDTETDKSVFRFKTSNIFVFNPLEKFVEYIVNKNAEIEQMAKQASQEYGDPNYDILTEHYKQSNRNQVLDNYIRTFIATGEKFDDLRNGKIILSENDCKKIETIKETLAEMEHRRWMLEKYYDGWTYGIITDKEKDKEGKEKELIQNKTFKIHECLQTWKKLDSKEKLQKTKENDNGAIELMINTIKTQKNEN